jgi:hypothetical protein
MEVKAQTFHMRLYLQEKLSLGLFKQQQQELQLVQQLQHHLTKPQLYFIQILIRCNKKLPYLYYKNYFY